MTKEACRSWARNGKSGSTTHQVSTSYYYYPHNRCRLFCWNFLQPHLHSHTLCRVCSVVVSVQGLTGCPSTTKFMPYMTCWWWSEYTFNLGPKTPSALVFVGGWWWIRFTKLVFANCYVDKITKSACDKMNGRHTYRRKWIMIPFLYAGAIYRPILDRWLASWWSHNNTRGHSGCANWIFYTDRWQKGNNNNNGLELQRKFEGRGLG